MSSNLDVIQRWFDVKTGSETRLLRPAWNNVQARDEALYSYGTHFPLVIEIAPVNYEHEGYWLLNGDRWGVATSRHQNDVRACANRTGKKSITIPFTVLDRAGIDRQTICPWIVQEDEWVRHVERTDNIENVPLGEQWQFKEPCNPEDADVTDHRGVAYKWKPGPYQWTRYEHLLGESVFTATVRLRDRLHREVIRPNVVFFSGFDRNEREGSHYFLCELPTSSAYTRRPETLDMALEMLKPDEVVKAEGYKTDVVRQGDIFAIQLVDRSNPEWNAPIRWTDHQMEQKGWTVRTRLDRHSRWPQIGDGNRFIGNGSHAATRVASKGDRVLVRGCLYHLPGEHKRQKLGDGKTWYTVHPNLVPHDMATEGRRAWSIVNHGGVAVD